MTIVTEYNWESNTWTDHTGEHAVRQLWRGAVQTVADKAKAALPDANGRIEKAVQIVLAGDIEFLDGGKAKVASQSNGTTEYAVCNGVCDCPDYPRAPQGLCKHRLSVAISRRATQLLKGQMAPLDSAPEPAPAQPAQELVSAQPSLPEAPASANCHVMIAGRQVQVTLRDTDETRLLSRLTTLLAQYPVEQASSQDHTPEGWCAVHSVQMRRNEKDGRSWWSHQAPEGGWCKGKPKGQGR